MFYGFLILLFGIVAVWIIARLNKPLGFEFFKNVLPLSALNGYFSTLKKRKNELKNQKYSIKTDKRIVKLQKMQVVSITTYKVFNIPKRKKFIIFEPQIFKLNFATRIIFNNQKLLNINNCFNLCEKKLSKNVKFRVKNSECLVQTLANNFALNVLKKENFNAIAEFNRFKNFNLLQKKEEGVFYYLFALALIVQLNALMVESLKFEKQIKSGAKTRRALTQKSCSKFRPTNCMKIYGAVVFNKNSSMVLSKFSTGLVKKKTVEALEYFMNLQKQINVSCLWLKFLLEKGFIK